MVTIRPLSRSLCRPLSRALVWLNDQARTYLLVDPAGADNAVLYTAKEAGAAGELVSVEYAPPATQATTTVAVSTNAITVTPGTKARMVVTGTLTSDGSTPYVFGPQLYQTILNGKAKYSFNPADAFELLLTRWDGTKWILGVNPKWHSTDDVATPDLVTTWTPQGSATGTPTVTAGISSAAQVIAAVNASTPAAALVTASVSGASTGPVAAVTAAFLTLIPANALTLDGEVLTLDGQILTLD